MIATLGLAACGSTGHASSPRTRRTAPVTSATRTAPVASATRTAAAAPARTGLARFLLATGEEVGFPPDPGEGGTFSTLKSWVSFTQLTAADERVLRSEGFVAAAQESIGGASNDGASFVEEFTSPAGARHEAVTDAQQSTQGGDQTTFFSVAGLPNSHGVLIDQSGEIGTDLYWTEGRCTMWLGNGAAVSLKSEVEAGARAIDRRTGGKCP